VRYSRVVRRRWIVTGSLALLALLGCSSSGADSPAASADASVDGSTAPDGAPDTGHVDATADATTDAATTCTPVADAGAPVLFYDLRSAPFPDASTPSVAVHIPPGFDPGNRPGVIAFFHGFDNCVSNVVGDTDTPCVDGGEARASYGLADQIDSAHVNAILVAVELEVDEATGNPGQLGTMGDFHDLLHELFTEHLDSVLGCPLDVDDLDRVVVSSHSGGYEAAADVLAYGMVPQVTEVDLLDSLYGETPTFYGWVTSNIARFDPTRADELRWMDIYTSSGGTEANSQDMAASAAEWLADAGLEGSLWNDETTDTLDAATYEHPMIFKLSALSHDGVPAYYVKELAMASGFATIP
jgi:hypothetical protein